MIDPINLYVMLEPDSQGHSEGKKTFGVFHGWSVAFIIGWTHANHSSEIPAMDLPELKWLLETRFCCSW